MKIKLVGKHNDLELGEVDGNMFYTPEGLLADQDHVWKILAWIDGVQIRVVKI